MSLDFLKETPEFKDLVRAVSSLPKTPEGQALLFGEEDRPRLSISGLTEAAVPYLFVQLALTGPRRVVFIRPSARPLSGFEDQARFFPPEPRLDENRPELSRALGESRPGRRPVPGVGGHPDALFL
jgi:hypothetical protein